MNKNILAGLAVSALALMAVSSPVMANNAAVSIDFTVPDTGYCSLYDGDGNLVDGASGHLTSTSSGKGNFKCYATGLANSTGKAVRYSGDGSTYCSVNEQLTTRWFETVDSEGNATLTCQFK